MTKADLAEKVAEHVNLTKKDIEVVIDTMFDSIAQALAAQSDGKVELRGFGSFRVRQRRTEFEKRLVIRIADGRSWKSPAQLNLRR